ncbi:LutC/YkgG family protein [Jeotgalibacillus soli]|uniref:Lactate utilization protein C n=1 Tax=Jeotgalibacillus soli TaxID=889306 RepID=A0A0C2SD36_9BACL|nr:lactate utilization protein C [Jeotgalibacillus soli]KIL51879.1 lactate utilization protein C [Jeotgalibacillus soli]
MKTGTVHNSDSFLKNISSRLGRDTIEPAVTLPEWSYSPQHRVLENATQEELIAVLEKQCQIIHTDFVRVKPENTLEETLNYVIESYGGGPIITWDDPRFEQSGLSSLFERDDTSIWDPSIGDNNIPLAEKANIGITFSDITLAESGTVVLFSGAKKGRAVSLLPTVYIALIPAESIVPRMTQATSIIHNKIQDGDALSSCINFITGPSNSADIEMKLVVGVHGPIKVTYIVY